MDDIYAAYIKAAKTLTDPQALDLLSDSDKKKLKDWVENLKYNWEVHALPKQRIPPGDWNTWLVLAGRGFGKLVLHSTPVLTTNNGFVQIKDLNVGDTIFDERGKPTTILAVHDDTPEVAYRLHFSDGTHIDACSEHQWVTWTHRDRKEFNRSDVESGALPENWPAWRHKSRRGGAKLWLDRDRVEQTLSLISEGKSIRAACKQVGLTRGSMTKFIKAGHWFPPPEGELVETGIGPAIRTTQDIVDTFTYGKRNDLNHSIPLAEAVELPDRDLPLDPYILGYWIGDGTTGDSSFTCDPTDQPSLKAALTQAGITLGLNKGYKTVSMLEMRPKLRAAGCFDNKVISDDYLYAGKEQRLALLRGLMDSDGYADSSHVEFCSMRGDHADAVMWLARSLGEKPRMYTGEATLNGESYGEKYRVTWRPARCNPFRLPRKAEIIKFGGGQESRNLHRMIVDYEVIEPQPMRCLTVDSPNSLFLVGEALIPTHNTRVGAETVRHFVQNEGYRAVGLIAPTAADARDTMIDGKGGSSLLEVTPPEEGLEYYPTKRQLKWRNGAVGNSYSAEEPERLRGRQGDLDWLDEMAAWSRLEDTYDQAAFGLRLGKRPKRLITTTPKPLPIIRRLLEEAVPAEEMKPGMSADVVVTRGSTMENKDNLAPQFLKELERKYSGTNLGRQEIFAEVLDENPNAIFDAVRQDDNRVRVVSGELNPHGENRFGFVRPQHGERSQTYKMMFSEIVVAVDPSMSADTTSDETGIVVMARGEDNHIYVLDDVSGIYSPNDWARKAIQAYIRWRADFCVAEVNQGGDLVENTIMTLAKDMGVPNLGYKPVRASRGKITRAEPVGALEEQGRIHHVGEFTKLEDQLVSFAPGYTRSPDRLDAYVWGAHHLVIQHERTGFFIA